MREKICFVVAEPMTAKAFLLDHLRVLSEVYDITLVAAFIDDHIEDSITSICTIKAVPIKRSIRLLSDLYALFILYRFFRQESFLSVHSVTPKAGLLAMTASLLAGVEFRFHTFTGQVWATKTGLFRFLLKSLDKLIFYFASRVLVDSPSQRNFLIDNCVVNFDYSHVLGDGSISGVDLIRFKSDLSARSEVRARHQIPEDAFVFLYLGRLNYEKGLLELFSAFSKINYVEKNAYLLVVGPDEAEVLKRHSHLISSFREHFVSVGFTNKPECYMAASDVFCLPSHREGFGTVILEAAACGIPSIGSNIYGISDAIVHGVTGLLHAKGSDEDLSEKMQLLLADKQLAKLYGANARLRAKEKFSKERLTAGMVEFYKKYVD